MGKVVDIMRDHNKPVGIGLSVLSVILGVLFAVKLTSVEFLSIAFIYNVILLLCAIAILIFGVMLFVKGIE